jgi:hypothetical protein
MANEQNQENLSEKLDSRNLGVSLQWHPNTNHFFMTFAGEQGNIISLKLEEWQAERMRDNLGIRILY